MRLNRFLASAGLGSRRGVEELIKSGRVKINGRQVDDLATQVQPEDCVKVGSRIVRTELPMVAMLNKPRGFLCTASDELERRTIFDLLPPGWPRVFHVGRLDKESEGLLIITNDGDLAMALTHPSHQIEKEYEVGLDRPFDSAHREKLLGGIRIEGGRARVEQINVVSGKKIKLVLKQGIKRQIRLMLYSLGYEVTHLRRIRVGSLRMGPLKPGESRLLTPKEIEALHEVEAAPAGGSPGVPPKRPARRVPGKRPGSGSKRPPARRTSAAPGASASAKPAKRASKLRESN